MIKRLSPGFAALLVLSACALKQSNETDATPPTTVEVASAKRGPMHRIISAEAILYPANQANIVPKISAPVQRFMVQRGDHVHQGQLLAVLENGDLRAAAQESRQLYVQAQASLENTRAAVIPDDLMKAKTDIASAQAGLDAAGRLFQNRVALLKEGAIAQKLVDDAKAASIQAESQLEVAKQHLASLKAVGQTSQLKSAEAQANAARDHYEGSAALSAYAEVRSPISGVVADRGVNVGDVAGSGSTLLTIVDVSRIVARANVPVNEAAALRRGQDAIIKGPNGDVKATVIVVSPAVDPNATTVQVWVEAQNPGESLKIGTSVAISMDAGELRDVVSVPATALLSSDDGGEKVMVAAGGVAHERSVSVGLRDGDEVQIINGVKAGEMVIISGALGLDDNVRVVIGKAGEAK